MEDFKDKLDNMTSELDGTTTLSLDNFIRGFKYDAQYMLRLKTSLAKQYDLEVLKLHKEYLKRYEALNSQSESAAKITDLEKTITDLEAQTRHLLQVNNNLHKEILELKGGFTGNIK